MANHASAEKRNRQRIVRTARNRAVRSNVRGLVKEARATLEGDNVADATAAVAAASVALDKAASKNVYHAKAASRTKSRLAKQLHQLSQANAG